MSYSCTENVDQILNRHNKRLLMKETQAPRQQSTCNCKIPQNCPVENKCLTESVIYKATVKQPTGGQCEYIGLTDNAFKTRYNLHNYTFRNESKNQQPVLLPTSGIREPTNHQLLSGKS